MIPLGQKISVPCCCPNLELLGSKEDVGLSMQHPKDQLSGPGAQSSTLNLPFTYVILCSYAPPSPKGTWENINEGLPPFCPHKYPVRKAGPGADPESPSDFQRRIGVQLQSSKPHYTTLILGDFALLARYRMKSLQHWCKLFVCPVEKIRRIYTADSMICACGELFHYIISCAQKQAHL